MIKTETGWQETRGVRRTAAWCGLCVRCLCSKFTALRKEKGQQDAGCGTRVTADGTQGANALPSPGLVINKVRGFTASSQQARNPQKKTASHTLMKARWP